MQCLCICTQNSLQLINGKGVSVFDISGYPQKSLYNPLQQQQEEQSYPPSQPHPPQNVQFQQGHPMQQSYPQQQGQDYSQPPEYTSQVGPPTYFELAQTTQPMSYTASAQQPTVMQPTNVSQNTTVVVAGVVAVSIFFVCLLCSKIECLVLRNNIFRF